jgi:hypothetical protein
MLIAVLYVIRDEDNPRQIIGELMAAVPLESSLSISQVPNDSPWARCRHERPPQQAARQPSMYRGRAEVTGFFGGLELVEPSVTPIQQWRPDKPAEASAVAAMWGGVALNVLHSRCHQLWDRSM